MKREFLQNFKVGEQPLTDEIIEAIMAENGRDVQAEQAKYADSLQGRLNSLQATWQQLSNTFIDSNIAKTAVSSSWAKTGRAANEKPKNNTFLFIL